MPKPPLKNKIVWNGDTPQLRRALLSWYDHNDRPLPWRERWQREHNPYYVWLSEIMLQQTVIKAVIPAYERFLHLFPRLKDVAQATTDELRQAVRGLGYYRRFHFFHLAAQKLSSTEPVQWPRSYAEWLNVPGVGRYTAAAIASITLNEPVGVVDGNVERVLCRIFDLPIVPNDPAYKPQFWQLMQDWVDRKRPGDFNQALMELGQLVCTKTSPRCTECPIQNHCQAAAAGTQQLVPLNKERQAFEDITMQLVIARNADGDIALCQRADNAKFLKGTWGLPTVVFDQLDGCTPVPTWRSPKKLGAIRHTITRHRLDVEVIETHASQAKHPSWRWIPISQVEPLLVTALDHKAWHAFLRHQQQHS